MKITIDATTLQRLSHLSNLKIDINDGRAYLVASNDTVACVEYLGEVNGANDSCYIRLDVDKVELEANFGGTFTFETLPELAMGSVVTTSGQDCNDFIIWPDESPLDKWKEWFIMPSESLGFMYCDLKQLISLWETSPSGEIVFPEVINNEQPVIVRDVNSANWVGVFIPVTDSKTIMRPATLPEWINA